MINVKSILAIVVLVTVSFVNQSCKEKKANNATQMEHTDKENTSAYVCVMRCEGSGSDEPGKCPKCGMKYVKNEGYKSN